MRNTLSNAGKVAAKSTAAITSFWLGTVGYLQPKMVIFGMAAPFLIPFLLRKAGVGLMKR